MKHELTDPNNVLRILVADDHPLFRAGMRYLLCEIGRTVEIVEAGTAEQALALWTAQDFDLMLTELVMPGMVGSSGIAAFKAAKPDTPIVVVSMLDAAQDIRVAIAAGAAGFIPKSARPEVMIEALKLVISGSIYLPPSILQRDVGAETAVATPEAAMKMKLSPCQTAVLAELVLGKSNKAIAGSLNRSEATIKVHIAAIMRALKVHSRTQIVLAAVRQGLVPPPPSWPGRGGEPGRRIDALIASLVANHA